jgi:Holliday junction resolvasome RuvABC ATP-dependent DNA helicase subunit
MQRYKVFFGPKHPDFLPIPSLDERRSAVSRENGKCAFSRFIGNDKAIRKLQAAAFDALGKPDHLCRDLAFAIYGPASAGKTTLAKMFATVVELPFVEVSPKSVKDMDGLFALIERVLKEAHVPLVEVVKPKHYVLPPCVVFFDEVHALSQSVVDGLLKATEHSDATMVTESGKTINCFNACWMLATTDEGKLFDAFRTRFSPVNLKYLPKSDIAKIVQLANPDFSDDVCKLVAHYNSRVPRKALEFARYVKLVHQMEGGEWAEVARRVAADEGIDEHGMHETHLAILRAWVKGR